MRSLVEGLRLFRQPSTSELLARKFRKIIGKQTFRDKLADLRLNKRVKATLTDKRTKAALGVLALTGANHLYDKHRFKQRAEERGWQQDPSNSNKYIDRNTNRVYYAPEYNPFAILTNRFASSRREDDY